MTVNKLYEMCEDCDSNTILEIKNEYTHELRSLATWCQTPCRLLNKKVCRFYFGDYKAGHAPRIVIYIE